MTNRTLEILLGIRNFYMNDCLFCKIIAGQIPNYTVYQDDHVLAFLDIHPCAKGHTVIVPKKHFADLQQMDSRSWSECAISIHKVIQKIQAVLKPDGMNIGMNDRPVAGQAVPHVHWHIIPRWSGDGGGSMHSIVRSKNVGEVKELAQLFVV